MSEILALLICLSNTAEMHRPAAMQKHLKTDKSFCLNPQKKQQSLKQCLNYKKKHRLTHNITSESQYKITF